MFIVVFVVMFYFIKSVFVKIIWEYVWYVSVLVMRCWVGYLFVLLMIWKMSFLWSDGRLRWMIVLFVLKGELRWMRCWWLNVVIRRVMCFVFEGIIICLLRVVCGVVVNRLLRSWVFWIVLFVVERERILCY